jgi:hypothetical protein
MRLSTKTDETEPVCINPRDDLEQYQQKAATIVLDLTGLLGGLLD